MSGAYQGASLKKLYLLGRKLLAEREPSDALLLCEELLGADRRRISLEGEGIPPEEAAEAYLAALRRRAEGEPLQYILGYTWFEEMKLLCGEGVLIPREDTSVLVELAAKEIGGREAQGMDLCAGTGAVALALARRCKNARIAAAELFPKPMEYLKKNIETYGENRVSPLFCDVLQEEPPYEELDFIVSNPPYIETRELPELQEEVQREPMTALDGGADGLIFYRHIVSRWKRCLKRGGLIAFEIGETQAEEVCGLLKANGFGDIKIRQDFAGLDRAVSGKLL